MKTTAVPTQKLAVQTGKISITVAEGGAATESLYNHPTQTPENGVVNIDKKNISNPDETELFFKDISDTR